MTTQQLRDTLGRASCSIDTLSQKAGVFTVRRGFFYTNGFTAEKLAEKIKAAVPGAIIIEQGEVWKAFRGGASVAQQSHWFVKFTVEEKSDLGGVIVNGVHCGRVVNS